MGCAVCKAGAPPSKSTSVKANQPLTPIEDVKRGSPSTLVSTAPSPLKKKEEPSDGTKAALAVSSPEELGDGSLHPHETKPLQRDLSTWRLKKSVDITKDYEISSDQVLGTGTEFRIPKKVIQFYDQVYRVLFVLLNISQVAANLQLRPSRLSRSGLKKLQCCIMK